MGQVQTSTGPFMNYPYDATSSDMPACQADKSLWHWTFNALMIEIENNQNKKNPRFLAKIRGKLPQENDWIQNTQYRDFI